MTKTIKCPVCGKSNDRMDLYCGKCGSLLPKENWDKREGGFERIGNSTYEVVAETETTKTVMVPKTREKEAEKKRWWKPPERKRPWYHPLELLFWTGWGLYIAVRFILREIKYYILWICWWGPPRDV